MPRILPWDEKLKYARPIYGKEFKFMTPRAMEDFAGDLDEEDLEVRIDILASEKWFCEHMTDYISNLIKVQLEDVKEDP